MLGRVRFVEILTIAEAGPHHAAVAFGDDRGFGGVAIADRDEVWQQSIGRSRLMHGEIPLMRHHHGFGHFRWQFQKVVVKLADDCCWEFHQVAHFGEQVGVDFGFSAQGGGGGAGLFDNEALTAIGIHQHRCGL